MLKLGYIGLSVLMTVILVLIAKVAIDKSVDEPEQRKRKLAMVIGGLLLWQAYIIGIGESGFLSTYELPPRFPIFLIFPAFAFTGIFIFKSRKKKWITSIPPHWLIYYQSFRVLIETLFVYSVAAEVLHPNVTIEGYNYDMLFAFTAPVIAFLVFAKSILPKKLALAWNFLGLAIIASIIFLFITTVYFPQFWGSSVPLMPLEFASGPYLLVAGFLMPSAVFIHVLSITQLMRKSQ